jgi:hypothetical protein
MAMARSRNSSTSEAKIDPPLLTSKSPKITFVNAVNFMNVSFRTFLKVIIEARLLSNSMANTLDEFGNLRQGALTA